MVYRSDCINVVKEKNLILCPCKSVVGYAEVYNERETVVFINVREKLFRPHATYIRHCSTNEGKAQRVFFTEPIENEQRSALDDFDVSNMVICPLTGFESDNENHLSESPTSSESNVPIIRVAAYVSENEHDLDENQILKCFKDSCFCPWFIFV